MPDGDHDELENRIVGFQPLCRNARDDFARAGRCHGRNRRCDRGRFGGSHHASKAHRGFIRYVCFHDLPSTDGKGEFRVPLLPPGSYSVLVDAPGFAKYKAEGIEVIVSETNSLTLSLTIKDSGTTTQVTADTDIAQLESSSLGRVVDEKAINSLPLANRNYTQILGLSPGVVVSLPSAVELGSGTQNVATNGAKTTANNFQFNGVNANNLAQNSAANDAEEGGIGIPAPDSIQEFKVQTANFDAAYGRGSGANVDLVSKSGTDRIHGSAWEFLRNNIFNANDFFLKQAGQPRPDLKQNQYGGAIGGPLFRKSLFYFVDYQKLLETNGLGSKQSALLPHVDFRSFRGHAGCAVLP